MENLEKCSSSALLVPQETSWSSHSHRRRPVVKQLWKHARCWRRETGKEARLTERSFLSGGEGDKYRLKSCSPMRKMQPADERARDHKLALVELALWQKH